MWNGWPAAPRCGAVVLGLVLTDIALEANDKSVREIIEAV